MNAPSPAVRLPSNFRKLSIEERIKYLVSNFDYNPDMPPFEEAERMIEAAVGYSTLPLGIAPRVLMNGAWYAVPMSTEEASVVASQMMAAGIISLHGGMTAHGAPQLGIGQVFVSHCSAQQYRKITAAKPHLMRLLEVGCSSLQQRGGGLQSAKICWHNHRANEHDANDTESAALGSGADGMSQQDALRDMERVALFEFVVDTVDAMGANRIIMLAESAARWLRDNLDCDILMAILSNDLSHSLSDAKFSIPISALRGCVANPMHAAEKVVLAAKVADTNHQRAVTHNKGIMNGISALALATGNDTRAIEAAVHSYASISGRYRALSRYWITDNTLCGDISLPLPFATVGGAVDAQRHARQAATIMQLKSAAELRALAATVGLQQNLAALLSLTNDGIARGHMRLHRRRASATRTSHC